MSVTREVPPSSVGGSPSREVSPRFRRVLDAFEAGSEARMATPATEEEIRRLEKTLGGPLPAELRAMLSSLGAGLYEHGHEIFGPSRVMIHDIELVPDMMSMRAQLAAEGPVDPQLVPFHRGRGGVHLVRVAGRGAGEVVAWPSGPVYPDLSAFFEQVMPRP